MATDNTPTYIDPRALDEAGRRELWRFVARFDDVGFDEFSARIAQVEIAQISRYPTGQIGGMVSARLLSHEHEGATLSLVWGEWGLLDPPFRGKLLLERAMLRGVARLQLRRPGSPIYFMLEAATVAGYLAIARSFGPILPRPGRPLPERERRLVSAILARHGELDWDEAKGVFHRGKSMRADPRPASGPPDLIDFYRRQNPGHAEGDALLVLVPMTLANIAAMPLRGLLARTARWRRQGDRLPGAQGAGA